MLNSLVYARPKYIQHRRRHPEVGRLVTCFKVAFPMCNCSRRMFPNCSQLRCKTSVTERSNKGSNDEHEEPVDVEAGVESDESANAKLNVEDVTTAS